MIPFNGFLSLGEKSSVSYNLSEFSERPCSLVNRLSGFSLSTLYNYLNRQTRHIFQEKRKSKDMHFSCNMMYGICSQYGSSLYMHR